jgi:energy-coupling factor transporter ATP-binding protein EcfA2
LDRGKIVRDGPVAEVLSAGDIANVFTRPPIIRLAESLHLQPPPLEPLSFRAALTSCYQLKKRPAQTLSLPQPRQSQPVIQLEDVCFSYDQRNFALHEVNLTISQGELVAILGRNGSGKTTLVRHIIGLLQPDSGKVTVLGKDVSITPTHQLAKDVGFCFQNPNHQIVSFTVRDEMVFGLKAHNIDPAQHEAAIQEALEFVDMLGYIESEVFDLGKGQKQRLALASVLTLKPSILIIDEPTTGQDPRMAEEIFKIIKRLNENGTTVLMITHKIDYAAEYAERAIVMQYGRVAYDGPMQPLLADEDLLRENSLDLPDTTRLATSLREYGIPPWLVSYEDLEKSLHELVEAENGN